jgi:hypothetical protein
MTKWRVAGGVDLFKKVGLPEEENIRRDLAEMAEKPGLYIEIIEADICTSTSLS